MHLNYQLCFVFLTAGVLSGISAQSIPHFQDSITLRINEAYIEYSQSWLDSLVEESAKAIFCFRIAGVTSTGKMTTSYVQLPQILSPSQVYRQIILYYSLIPTEILREKEKIIIYPYFHDAVDNPSFIVNYKRNGVFEIEALDWKQIPVPQEPLQRDMRIFNQILQTSFNAVESFGSLSEEIFEEVALQNHLTRLQVMNLYKRIILWQQGRYFCRADTLHPGLY